MMPANLKANLSHPRALLVRVAGRFIHDRRGGRIWLDVEPEESSGTRPFLLHPLMIGAPLSTDGDHVRAKIRVAPIRHGGTEPVVVPVGVFVRAPGCVEASGVGQSPGRSR